MAIAALSDVANLDASFRAADNVYSDAGSTLAADLAAVQQWNDQTANTWHCTQATLGNRLVYRKPGRDGLRALQHPGQSGTDRWFDLHASFTSDRRAMTVFFVLELPWSPITIGNGTMALFSPGAGNDTGLITLQKTSNTGRNLIECWQPNTQIPNSDIPNSKCVIAVRMSATNVTAWINGRQRGQSAGPLTAGSSTGGRILKFTTGGTAWPTPCNLHDWCKYGRALTDNEVADVSDLLMRSNGIGATRGQVFCIGDSITAGMASDLNNDLWPNMNVFPSDLEMYNCSTSGATIDDLSTQFATRVQPVIDMTLPLRCAVILAGANNQGSDTGATIWTKLQTLITTARNAGINKVILGSITPRTDGGGNETNRNAANALIEAASSSIANRVMKTGTHPRIGTTAQVGTTWYWDQVHPNAFGKAVIASLAKDALQYAGVSANSGVIGPLSMNIGIGTGG